MFEKLDYISTIYQEDGTYHSFFVSFLDNHPSIEDVRSYYKFDVLNTSTFYSFLERDEEEEIYEEYTSLIYNNEYRNLNEQIEISSDTELSPQELYELSEYINIYNNYDCTRHWEVNQIISDENRWDDFPTIRALNTHRSNNRVRGILPKYFAIICNVLSIDSGSRNPITESKNY